MKKKLSFLLAIIILLASCTSTTQKNSKKFTNQIVLENNDLVEFKDEQEILNKIPPQGVLLAFKNTKALKSKINTILDSVEQTIIDLNIPEIDLRQVKMIKKIIADNFGKIEMVSYFIRMGKKFKPGDFKKMYKNINYTDSQVIQKLYEENDTCFSFSFKMQEFKDDFVVYFLKSVPEFPLKYEKINDAHTFLMGKCTSEDQELVRLC